MAGGTSFKHHLLCKTSIPKGDWTVYYLFKHLRVAIGQNIQVRFLFGDTSIQFLDYSPLPHCTQIYPNLVCYFISHFTFAAQSFSSQICLTFEIWPWELPEVIVGVVFSEIIEIIADESHNKSKNQSVGWPWQYTQAFFSLISRYMYSMYSFWIWSFVEWLEFKSMTKS